LEQRGKLRMSDLVSLGVLAAITAALGIVLGGRGIAMAVILAIVWLAWRFDNRTGTYLVLVVLFLIALAVPALLLLLMAATH
jgi:hypothetical protein